MTNRAVGLGVARAARMLSVVFLVQLQGWEKIAVGFFYEFLGNN